MIDAFPNNKKYQAYWQGKQTMANLLQLIDIYDKLISLVQQAKQALKAKDYEKLYFLSEKCRSSVNALRLALDHENSKYAAQVLDAFYARLEFMLLDLECNFNAKICDEIIKQLKLVKNKWVDMRLNDEYAGDNIYGADMTI